MLTPLSNPKRFPPYCVLDIETNRDKFLLAGFTNDGKSVEFYTDLEGFVESYFVKRYRGSVLYAHFGGGFDFRFLLPLLRSRFGDEKITVFQQGLRGRIFLIKVKKHKNVWTLADSFAILPASLDSLGRFFNVENPKLDKPDFSNLRDTEETRTYLRSDVLCLYQVIEKYRKQPEIADSGQAFTLAQSAMQVFRRKLRTPILNLSEKEEDFIRKCAYGGRTEVFKRRGFDLRCYDVNSMYPYVMRNFPMPIGNAVRTYEFKEGKPGFYLANVKLKDCYIPPLPYFHNELGRLIFPVGSLSNCYCTGAELDNAREFIDSIEVVDGLYFPETEFLFAEYVDYFYSIKQNSTSDSPDYFISKLMLNSLFGKFGQRRERENLVFSQSPETGMIPYNEDEGIWLTESRSKAKYIIPSISAHITALARVRLFNLLNEDSYYCDTDSVYTSKQLEESAEIGGLKLELQAIGECLFLAPKTYANSAKIKHKGIPSKDLEGRRLLHFEKFRDAYNGNLVTVKWNCFDGFTESFPKKTANGRKQWDQSFIHWKERSRSLPTMDRKRVWTRDDSRPIMLGVDIEANP